MNRIKASKNIFYSIVFKVILIVISLFVRRYLIKFLGNEASGLYSLYVSILGFLSIAELGVGTAITFSMYKPIIDGNTVLVKGLYDLYKKIYLIIGGVVLFVGTATIPILPLLAKDSSNKYNLSITFMIFLVSTVLTYVYAYKTSFINANKDNYITTIIRSTGLLFEAILQIVFLLVFKSFLLFFIAILVSGIYQMILTNYIFEVKYKAKINVVGVLTDEVKKDVSKNITAMFMHKIGGLLVNTSTNLIISAMISVILLGKYSNYITIMTGMTSILYLIFSSITSILGQLFVQSKKEYFKDIFNKIYIFSFIIGLIFFLGFYSVVDEIIILIFGNNQILSVDIKRMITISYFVQFMRQTTLTFRDATGTFYQDRYKPIIEGIFNIGLSLLLVNSLGVIGILIANIATNLFICHIVEPYVLFKYGFGIKPQKYYIINYLLIIIFTCSIYIYDFQANYLHHSNTIIHFFLKGTTSILISFGILFLIYILNKSFRKIVNELITYTFSILFKKIKS